MYDGAEHKTGPVAAITLKRTKMQNQDRHTTSGIPQGAVLSPTLYSLYTNDIPNKHPTQIALYVDDTCLYITHKRLDKVTLHLQNAINELEDWLNKWKIKINRNKIQTILFTKIQFPPIGNVRLKVEEIE